MLYADFLLTPSESAVRQEIETLNTSSLLDCYIIQKLCWYIVREKRAESTDNGEEGREQSAYREEGLNDVCLDGAEGLVFDDDEDLLLFLQVDEVAKP